MAETAQGAIVSRVHEMPFGPRILPNGKGVEFRLWAPGAQQVELLVEGEPDALLMNRSPDGWHRVVADRAKHGSLYQFRIDCGLAVPDPASRHQPHDVHGPSLVIDPARFEWQDTGWRGRPWAETVIYELHPGTFSARGDFKGIEEKLDYLADLGVTAIELMPVADFPGGRNWGYDGVLPYAPDSVYGHPDDLKRLVQAAHQKGLMVFLDVVYNHFGPEGNYLHVYAKDFFNDQYHTPWGAAIHFEGPREVRDFFIHNALYWLREFHMDGLRFDAVHAIHDQSERHFLTELAETVRAEMARSEPGRHIHLILEHDDNAARFLGGAANGTFDAQWNDDFHHAMHVLLSEDATGYYSDYARAASGRPAVAHLGRCLTEGFAYQGEPSPYRDNAARGEKSAHLHPLSFVDFLQNHDQIGNRAFGERLTTLTAPQALRAAAAVLLLAPGVPLLFMGEEWASRNPFLFFCDFNAELAPLVTEGRRKEFARFPQFGDPALRERIPDPSAEGTFLESRLDWDSLGDKTHAEWLEFYKSLLALRQEKIVPLLKRMSASDERNYEVPDDTGLVVQWHAEGELALYLAVNPGDSALTFKPVDRHNLELLFESGDMVFDQWKAGRLPGWSALWLIAR